MKTIRILSALSAMAFVGAVASALAIQTVPVDDPHNPSDVRYADPGNGSQIGSVGHSYRIGRTEITNTQYVHFLNAVAADDLFGLYNTDMKNNPAGGIVRDGLPGSFTYSVKAPALEGTYAYDSKPVVFVSWGDAARFSNWLHNGQPTGGQTPETTENGAYALLGATTDATLSTILRNAGARWWIPTEDEWYKAAYYDPNSGSYYDYPTGTDVVPDNNLPASDSGNSANHDSATGNAAYPLTDTGAYEQSASPYGTFDQGGNVWEWNEALFPGSFSSRRVRGGAWVSISSNLRPVVSVALNPTVESSSIGFRIATLPEPSAAMLVGLAPFILLGGRCLRSRGRYRPHRFEC